ncbi:MAG: hypothetical protein AAF639_35290 [Chloroflexota bacterium]
MMLWTYRVFRDEDGYCVRVVYHEHDGQLTGYQREPATPTGRMAEELAQDIVWFQEAFDLPTLTMDALDAELATQTNQPSARRTSREETKMLDELLAEFEQVGLTELGRGEVG